MKQIKKIFYLSIFSTMLINLQFKSEQPSPSNSSIENLSQTITSTTNVEKKEQPQIINANITPKETEKGNIYLNLQDTSLKEVLNYIADQKNINIIPHKDLDNIKVSMSTRDPLTLTQAWNVLLTLLDSNNFSLINVNNLYRIVPSNLSKSNPLPHFIDTDPETLPNNNSQIRYIYIFKNIKSSDAAPLLEKFLSPGSYMDNQTLNAFLITESSLNIKAAMKIIKELDTGGLREDLQIIQLQEANADDIAKKFNDEILGQSQEAKAMQIMRMVPQKRIAFFSKAIKIIPDSRLNRLILLGPSDNLKTVKTFIEKNLDKSIVSPNSRLHIKELKYVDASSIETLLKDMVSPPTKDSKTLIVGQVKYFEDVNVVAEKSQETSGSGDSKTTISIGSGNRLIIACNRDDWRRIEDFIDKIDKPQPQVAIEVFFVDVRVDKEAELGAQIHSKNSSKHAQFATAHIQAGSGWSGMRNLINIPVGSTPNTNKFLGVSDGNFLSLGRTGNLYAMIKTYFTDETTQILSQPYLVIKNQTEGIFNFEEERLINGQIDYSSTTPVQKTEPVKASTMVKLTPRINLDGIIDLKITINIAEFEDSTGNLNARTNRNIETRSTLGDGEVLVVGGLRQNKKENNVYKTSPLEAIPILGYLFKNKDATIEKKDLFIFIRPTLIKPRFEGRPCDYTQLKLDYAKLQIQRQEDFLLSKDPIDKMMFHPSQERFKTLAEIKDEDIKDVLNFTNAKDIPQETLIDLDPTFSKITDPKKQLKRQKRIERRLEKQEEEEIVEVKTLEKASSS